MNGMGFRSYPRNSPRAAARILAAALLANGDIKPAEWQGLAEARASERLGLQDLEWELVIDELCEDLMARPTVGGDALIDRRSLAAWLDEVDDPELQRLLVDLCVQVIESDGEVQFGESLVLRAAIERWVLPIDEQARLEPMIYGLDFQVLAKDSSRPGTDTSRG